MRSPKFAWRMPVDVLFGEGCSDSVPAMLDGRSAVVLAFEPAAVLGLQARWQAELGERLLAWVSVPEGLSSLAMARELSLSVWSHMAASRAVVLVAVGGGSTMDLAKVLRCRPVDGQFESIAAALRGMAPWPAMETDPLWLIPTTAGTGSEVTRWATVWDTDFEPTQKRSLDEPWGYAQRAFVDPALTLSCPPTVTRDTALDTLAHALESLWNRHANPFSDKFAVQAARRVIANLAGVLARPQDIAMRTQLSLASLEAGLAFSQTRTALAHALSYDVTLALGVPHGLACAIWLPTAWRLAQGRDKNVDNRLSEVFASGAADGAEQLAAWLGGVGVDASPLAYGITDADARIMEALNSPRGRNFIGSPA